MLSGRRSAVDDVIRISTLPKSCVRETTFKSEQLSLFDLAAKAESQFASTTYNAFPTFTLVSAFSPPHKES